MLTTKEFAEKHGVCDATIYRHVEAGRIKPVRSAPGGHMRFPDDLSLPMTTSQFAKACGVSARTIRGYVRAGRIKPARSKWFDETQIEEFKRVKGTTLSPSQFAVLTRLTRMFLARNAYLRKKQKENEKRRWTVEEMLE